MEMFSTLLALCERNSSVISGFLSQRVVILSFDIFFYLRISVEQTASDLRFYDTHAAYDFTYIPALPFGLFESEDL